MKTLPAETGETDARKSIYTEPLKNYHVENPDRTLYDLFNQGLEVSKDKKFLGTSDGEKYSWISYSEGDVIRRQLGSALVKRGLKKGDRVGVSSQNTAEWTLLGLGCDIQSFVLVPLYDTLGEEAVKFILDQTELTVLFAHPRTIKNYIKYLPEAGNVKLLVRLPGLHEESEEEHEKQKGAAAAQNVELITWKALLEEGKNSTAEPTIPEPDDICTLCYTSGTTGFPKGAMLTHRNIVSTTVTVMQQLGTDVMRADDIHISYLPASHVFERLVQLAVICVGGAIGFWQGDVKKLATDMQALKPTIFPAVPRILNRLYDKIQSEVATSKVKSAIFNMALNSKLKKVENGIITNSSIADAIVFKKIQNMLGGRIRLMATGAAPLKPSVLQFFRAALGAAVYEGYGQTENCGACTLTLHRDHSVGHVGGVVSSCIVKLDDVPDMGYYTTERRGEVCIKGMNVMKGYYNNPEKTAETIDEDGWLHTGDIGEWTEEYGLKIIDRKKNIFKLSQGEYIAPEKIELVYDRVPLIGQVMVYGESLKSSIIAIVVPEETAGAVWAKLNNLSEDPNEYCKSAELKSKILSQIKEAGEQGGLRGFEIVQDILVTPVPFSVENDQTTPTFKLKRNNIARCYRDQINKMYESII